MSELALLELCVWREARGEGFNGKRGVAHVILNRTKVASWWNHHVKGSIARVILHPYQFSSFNLADINSDKWPADDDLDFGECVGAAALVSGGTDEDNTDGATHYFDVSISWPTAWGEESAYNNTLNIGRLRFWKLQQSGAST